MTAKQSKKTRTPLDFIRNSKPVRYLQQHPTAKRGSIIGLLVIGVIARFSLAWRGHNFDFESWLMIGDIVDAGKNVYAETWRLPYGPVWAVISGLLRDISLHFSNPDTVFRYLVIGLLTLVDVGIWAILKKYFGYVVAFVFFLCPISIVITGYHNQIDIFALLLALLGVAVIGKESEKLEKRHFAGLALLGLSLMTKHLFIAFPIWLAIRQKGFKQKVIVLLFPVALFLLAFAPFWSDASENITHNVFLYKSFGNAPLWYMIVPRFLQSILTPEALFYGALLIFGFITRKRPLIESALLYTLVLVVFSTAIASQYLVTVVPAIAVFYNHILGLYIVYSSLYVAIASVELHIARLVNNLPAAIINPIYKDHLRSYDWLMVILAVGFFWYYGSSFMKRTVKSVGSWLQQEFKYFVKSF